MLKPYVYKNTEYNITQVLNSKVSGMLVCLDTVFKNNHQGRQWAHSVGKFQTSPIPRTRSACAIIRMADMMSPKDVSDATDFFEDMMSNFDGCLIPNLHPNWYPLIKKLHAVNKLVFTTTEINATKLFFIH